MLYFGPAGVPPSVRSTEEGIRLVSSLGLNALEVEFVRGVRMKPEEARRVGKTAAELGVRLSAHAPYYINLNSRDREIIKRSKEHILLTMRMAHELGAKIIVVHAGFYSGMPSDAATEIIAQGVAEVREKADDEGCSGVVLGLETMGKKASWGTFREMRRVCSRVKNVQPVVDFAHLHARGHGSIKTAADFEKILAEFERFKSPFLHAHFTGIEWGPSGEKRHLEVSAASPDFRLLAPLLPARKYDIALVCESPLLEKDALLMKRIAETGEPESRGAGTAGERSSPRPRGPKVLTEPGGVSWKAGETIRHRFPEDLWPIAIRSSGPKRPVGRLRPRLTGSPAFLSGSPARRFPGLPAHPLSPPALCRVREIKIIFD